MPRKYNYTKKTGRPEKYIPSYVDEEDKFLSTCGREQQSLPTRYKFSLHLGVDDETLTKWGQRHPDFAVALKKIDEAQRLQLMDDGLYGGKEVNPAMAIFLLKVNHKMVETSRTELTGKDGKDLPTPILTGVVKEEKNP